MIWFVFVLLSFATGLRAAGWTILIWPAASIGLGVRAVATEQPEYDMHGFGYLVGGIAAAACAIAWLIGRALATFARHRSHHPD
jgi:hypothetical protein